MAKKQKCPEFENHERWLVAFADMMTLLFALFVVLYSIANVDKAKLAKVSESIQKAFGVPSDDPAAKDGGGGPSRGNSRTEGILQKLRGNTSRDSMLTKNRREMSAIITADIQKIEAALEERLYGNKSLPEGAKTDREDRVVFVNREADGIRVSLLARKFFAPNQTGIDPSARSAINAVGAAIKGMNKVIRVEGHTDSLPFRMNGLTNWELSSMRAAAVVRQLIENGSVEPNMVYAAGFADTHPVAPNDTKANRMLNRRVDIKIMYDNPSDSLPPDTPTEFNRGEEVEKGSTEPEKHE